MMINASNAILLIFVNNILMQINMENAFAIKVITMIAKIVYVSNAQNFG